MNLSLIVVYLLVHFVLVSASDQGISLSDWESSSTDASSRVSTSSNIQLLTDAIANGEYGAVPPSMKADKIIDALWAVRETYRICPGVVTELKFIMAEWDWSDFGWDDLAEDAADHHEWDFLWDLIENGYSLMVERDSFSYSVCRNLSQKLAPFRDAIDLGNTIADDSPAYRVAKWIFAGRAWPDGPTWMDLMDRVETIATVPFINQASIETALKVYERHVLSLESHCNTLPCPQSCQMDSNTMCRCCAQKLISDLLFALKSDVGPQTVFPALQYAAITKESYGLVKDLQLVMDGPWRWQRVLETMIVDGDSDLITPSLIERIRKVDPSFALDLKRFREFADNQGCSLQLVDSILSRIST